MKATRGDHPVSDAENTAETQDDRAIKKIQAKINSAPIEGEPPTPSSPTAGPNGPRPDRLSAQDQEQNRHAHVVKDGDGSPSNPHAHTPGPGDSDPLRIDPLPDTL
jgi:hypothetical protein